MQTIELPSPAKINLFLDVLGKRKDGYHDIITVFEKIDLCDKIRLSRASSGIEISSNNKELPLDENNLVYRACSLFKEAYGIQGGVRVHIEKAIPIAAGLGGGSSNAATALKGLAALWAMEINNIELASIGEKIGADVPFFSFNYSFAIGRGRGDDISPLNSSLDMWHVIISPPVRVLTKEIYENSNLNLTRNRPDVKIIVRSIEQNDFEGIKRHLYNALEPVVSKRVTAVSLACDFVKKMGFNAIRVSGSGPTIFVLTRERKEAEKLRSDFLNSFASDRSGSEWKIFVARTFSSNIGKGVIPDGYNRGKDLSKGERRS